MSDKVKLVVVPHPFRTIDRTITEADPKPIKEYIEEYLPGVLDEFHVLVSIDSDPVVEEDFGWRVPEKNQTVLIRVVPQRNDNESRKAGFWSGLLFIAGLAINIASLGTLSWLGTPMMAIGLSWFCLKT